MARSWRERLDALPGACLAQRLKLEVGSLRDYQALARYHYRSGRPATATRVLVLRDEEESVTRRFRRMTHSDRVDTRTFARPAVSLARGRRGSLPQPLPGGGGLTRTIATAQERRGERLGEPVAVLVESLPSLACRMRDYALNGRYGSWLGARQRARLLNEEVRCISRVIVDPRWRGLGLAVRLVKHALATATTPVTEALAAMGKIHPFFEKAGMAAYPRPAHEHDARLTAALQAAGLGSAALTEVDAAARRIEAMQRDQRAWIIHELTLWHRRSRAGHRVTSPLARPSVRLAQERRGEGELWREALRAGQTRLGLEPVYYVKVREEGRGVREEG